MADAQAPTLSQDADGVLRAGGPWTLAHAAELLPELARAGRASAIDARGLSRMDCAGAVLLLRLARGCGLAEDAIQVADAQRAMFELVRQAEGPAPARGGPRRPLGDMLARVGGATVEAALQTRTLVGFLGLSLATLARTLAHPRRFRITSTVHHMEQAGLDAVPLVALLGFLVGAVIAYLGASVLRDFGAEIYVVELVSFAYLREFGVLLTAVLLAGRTASAFTAQIGAMKSREEIDAIRTLGLDPIELLVLPRLLALVVMLPLLSFIAALAGIGGGMLVASAELGLSNEVFVNRFQESFELRHLMVGLAKAPVFALVIALIGCLEGFKVAGTAQSVGERTTSSVVQAIFVVILIDAVAAVFFMEMGW